MNGGTSGRRLVTVDAQKMDEILFNSVHDEDGDDGESAIFRRALMRSLREIVEQELSQQQRLYLVEYYYRRCTMQEIATTYSVNVSTVSRTIARGRRKIFDRLKYLIELRRGRSVTESST